MYETYFAFHRHPFPATPNAENYFPGTAIEHARQTLLRCIERGTGPGLVIGPVGTGKTLLCQQLAAEFQDRYQVAMLTSTRLCTRRALLQAILYELGQPYRDMEEGELRLSLIDRLVRHEDCPHGMLLIADEAHAMPLVLLEEIRMITNLVSDGQPRVRLVLAGGPALEERFASPRMESFSQRVAARCYLESFTRDETIEYVRSRIASCRSEPEPIFADGALQSVYHATNGVPRLINQLCDHALILAAVGGHGELTAEGVDEAWADLQQLPTPAQYPTDAPAAGPAGVVEFGSLEGDSADPPAPANHAETGPEVIDPEARLDEIERSIAQASGCDAETVQAETDSSANEHFRPEGSMGPELELVFHGPHDPFGDAFAEEEVVIDRYASLASAGAAHWPQVSSTEGHAIATLLDSVTAADATATHEDAEYEDGPAPAAPVESDGDGPIGIHVIDETPQSARLDSATPPNSADEDQVVSSSRPVPVAVMSDAGAASSGESSALEAARESCVDVPEIEQGVDTQEVLAPDPSPAPPEPRRRYRRLFSTLKKNR